MIHGVFVAARGRSLVAACGGCSSLGGFLLLQSVGSRACGLSRCSLSALQCGLGHGMQALWPCSTWGPPGSGLEPVSVALAGGLLTPGSLGRFLQEPF